MLTCIIRGILETFVSTRLLVKIFHQKKSSPRNETEITSDNCVCIRISLIVCVSLCGKDNQRS
jgi:hypothetical protein